MSQLFRKYFSQQMEGRSHPPLPLQKQNHPLKLPTLKKMMGFQSFSELHDPKPIFIAMVIFAMMFLGEI